MEVTIIVDKKIKNVDIKNLLASFSIEHHKWLLAKDDKRSFSKLTDDFLNTIK